MAKTNAANERIKRDYFLYLRDAKRMSEKSIDQVAAAIASFEASTGGKDFRLFHIEQARSFKRRLIETPSDETGKPLAHATVYARLKIMKAFFQWLAGRSGFRRIAYDDAGYFNLAANETRIANAKRPKPTPSLEQIRHVLRTMPHGTDIQKRNRALIAFAILTGGRDDAIASLSLKHIDFNARTAFFDARHVRTKFRKTFTTWFFPDIAPAP